VTERAPARRARRDVLFVMAHQDDECLLSTRIAREIETGCDVHCVYLTNGEVPTRGFDGAVRDAECLRVLARLGVLRRHVYLLGTRHDIKAETLAERLPEAFDLLETQTSRLPLQRIYCLAYEGGHPDHDATHLLTAALALKRGLALRTWQVPSYTAFGASRRLFRLHHPIPRRVRTLTRTLPAGLAIRHALLFREHRSQWRTWLGLLPGHLLERVVLRRERFQALDLSALGARPHAGPLLYEQRLGTCWESFERSTRAFREQHGLGSSFPPTSARGRRGAE